jgi:hypothetical protein
MYRNTVWNSVCVSRERKHPSLLNSPSFPWAACPLSLTHGHLHMPCPIIYAPGSLLHNWSLLGPPLSPKLIPTLDLQPLAYAMPSHTSMRVGSYDLQASKHRWPRLPARVQGSKWQVRLNKVWRNWRWIKHVPNAADKKSNQTLTLRACLKSPLWHSGHEWAWKARVMGMMHEYLASQELGWIQASMLRPI